MVQLDRIHRTPSHVHLPLRKGQAARMEEARGNARTFPSSYSRIWNQSLVPEGVRQRKQDAQHRTHLSLRPQQGTQL